MSFISLCVDIHEGREEKVVSEIIDAIFHHKDFNINEQGFVGETLLYEACRYQRNEIAKFLLLQGALDIACHDGMTPFARAISRDMTEVAEWMIIEGLTDINRYYNGQTTLYFACYMKNERLAKLLIEHGVLNLPNTEDGTTPFMEAAANGMTETIQLMLDKGLVDNINAQNNDGETALFLACRWRHTPTAELLLKYDARNTAKANGTTPFMLAAHSDMVEIMQLMLDNKKLEVDINAQTTNGITALYWACNYRKTKAMKFLVDREAHSTVIDNDTTTFILLVDQCEVDIVALMLKKKLVDNIDAQDENGKTALYYACCNHHEPMAILLIKNGARNIGIGNNAPFFKAIWGMTEVVKLMLFKGLIDNIDAKNNYDETALDYIADSRDKSIVKLLIQNGACIDHFANSDNKFIKTLVEYQNGKHPADKSDNYQLAMLNKLHRTYVNSNPTTQELDNAKDLVKNNTYLQSFLARDCMSNQEVIDMFDGDMKSFFIKCRKPLEENGMYCKYMDSVVNDICTPLNIRKSAIASILSQEFFNAHIGILQDYIDKNANKMTQDKLWEMANADFRILKLCYDYCIVKNICCEDEYVQSKLSEWLEDYGENSMHLANFILQVYPHLWQECSNLYPSFNGFNSHYAYEFSCAIKGKLDSIYEINELKRKSNQECEKDIHIRDNLYILLDKPYNHAFVIDIANYYALDNKTDYDLLNLVNKWHDLVKINETAVNFIGDENKNMSSSVITEEVKLIEVSDDENEHELA